MDIQKCDLCRLCLESINGFDEILLNNSPSLINSIFLITGLEVVSDPVQCEYLCSRCCSLLEQSVEFRKTCINNDSIFREMTTGLNHGEDCKSEFEKPLDQYIKQEAVDLGEASSEINDALQNNYALPHEIIQPSVQRDQMKTKTPNLNSKSCKSELEKPVVEYIKLEPIDLAEPPDEAYEELESNHTLPNEVVKPFVERKRNPNKNVDGVAKPSKSKRVYRRIQCQQCGKMIVNFHLKGHMETHNPNRRTWCCPHCPKKYNHTKDLKIHIDAHHPGKTMAEDLNPEDNQEIQNPKREKKVCPYCPKECVLSRDLNRHINVHHTHQIRYTCKECGKSYLTQSSLNVHYTAVHSGEKRYACSICGEKFKRSSVRLFHQRTVHSTVRPFACAYCDKSFKSKAHLTYHTSTHTRKKSRAGVESTAQGQGESGESNDTEFHNPEKKGSRKVQCQECDTMVAPKHLKEHQKIHNPNKPRCDNEIQFPCKQCGKSYTSQHSLNVHCSAMHSGEKKYACTVCGGRFAKASILSYHQRKVHSTFRPFACEHCEKAFLTKNELSSHTCIHVKKNPEEEATAI